MREIKFRLWLDGAFTLWGFFDDGDGLQFACPPHGGRDKMTIGDAQEKSQQFTGFCDKNGAGIWEGDILRHEERILTGIPGRLSDVRVHIQVVEWDGEYRNSYAWGRDYEVIGNIYENPELLEPR